MGNNICCGEEQRHIKPITNLLNLVPPAKKYKLKTNETVRLSEISVRKSEKNRIIFTMAIKDSADIHMEIPVIN